MRVITFKRLQGFWGKWPDAEQPLRRWHDLTRSAGWISLAETRWSFPHADLARVASGNQVTVFNIGGNKFRLISAIHYRLKNPKRGRVYVLRVLTHAEYNKEHWKDEL